MYQVIYCDGGNHLENYDSPEVARHHVVAKILCNKNLRSIAIFRNDSNFHSTTQTDKIVEWWGNGKSYYDNMAKKDASLAAKKINL